MDISYCNGEFNFTIRVQEGSEDYYAKFEGRIDQYNQIEGKAFVLPERSLLGTFTGEKI